MKELNTNEIQHVSGAFDILTLTIGCVAATSLIWNFKQSVQIQEMSDAIFSAGMLTLYQEAQLGLLPFYDEISSLSPEHIFNMI